MGPEVSHIVASLSKSLEVDRSPGATQRASDVAQDQITGESTAVIKTKKTDALEQMRRDKIRQERERRRHDMERHANSDRDDDADQDEGESHIDLVA
ncbi:MAG: hypothetical protein ABFD54_13645 [Armatimonadota bacterium]|nr:hypothetical protein [bacterium]